MDELAEQHRITQALEAMMTPDEARAWLHTPNARLAGLSPFYCIARGWLARVWDVIDFMRSGVPV